MGRSEHLLRPGPGAGAPGYPEKYTLHVGCYHPTWAGVVDDNIYSQQKRIALDR